MTDNSIDPDVRRLLRLEGATFFAAALTTYGALDFGWLLFALLLFLPDLSILAYRAGPEVGARTYNLAHTYLFPGLVAVAALVTGQDALIAGALIWTAHIGLDRVLGYGLKLPTNFRDTHLGPIGRE